MLAIGINFEAGLTWSIDVDTNDAQMVASRLAAHNDNGTPDEILVIVNSPDGPIVDKHYNQGRHYS